MRNFRRFALLNTIFVYLVIFAGGLVRVSGAGLGCPDWPKCFGRWIPPTSLEQLPPDIDPSLFNFTLAWIEYVNRLVGVIVGFLIAATAIWAILKYRKQMGIVLPSIAAALLVAFQGWHGSVVVASELHQPTVSIHLLLALLIAGLMIFISLKAFQLEQGKGIFANVPKEIKIWTAIIMILAFVQILMGTQIRSTLENLVISSPLLSDSQRLSEVGLINHIHLVLGILTGVLTWVFVLVVNKKGRVIPSIVKTGALIAAAVVFIQLLIGIGFIAFGLPPVLQVFHLWTGSIFIGILFMTFSVTILKTEN
jgi:cytochrome c oxidase assembly protein subunit 15